MDVIYRPQGRAGEYGDYAVNIYTGCNHGCTYCYAAKNANRWGKDFADVRPRANIAEKVTRDCKKLGPGHLIHLCFTCDPYPAEIDTSATREVIKAIKNSGNHVQILTKGGDRATRDFDLLGENDWFGVTITGAKRTQEPHADHEIDRKIALQTAKEEGIRTWVSCEPVFHAPAIYEIIAVGDFIDNFKIGKLNHYTSDIDWAQFGRDAEALCIKHGRSYMIKEDLRREMEKGRETRGDKLWKA